MNDGLIALRYARALFASAKEKRQEDAVYKDICNVSAAFEQFPQLKHALSSPAINDEDKIRLLTTAAGAKPGKELQAFIRFVVKKKREDYLGSMARMYERLYRKDKNLVVGTIASASELTDKTLSTVKSYISKQYDSEVELRSEVDPELIGGFVLDIEGKRLDASIKGQLSKLYKYAGHKAK